MMRPAEKEQNQGNVYFVSEKGFKRALIIPECG